MIKSLLFCLKLEVLQNFYIVLQNYWKVLSSVLSSAELYHSERSEFCRTRKNPVWSYTTMTSWTCHDIGAWRPWPPPTYITLHTSFGIGQCTIWSSLPGLSNAGSIRSGREVAAKTKMPWERPSTPSNWVNNWLTTLSVTPVLSWPRLKMGEYRVRNYKLPIQFTVKNKSDLFYFNFFFGLFSRFYGR